MLLFGYFLQGIVISDGTLNVLRHHHCLGQSLQLMVTVYLRIEVIQHDLCLGGNGLGITLHHMAQQLLRPFIVILRILLNALGQFIIAFVRRVVRQHIVSKEEAKSFLVAMMKNRLPKSHTDKIKAMGLYSEFVNCYEWCCVENTLSAQIERCQCFMDKVVRYVKTHR